jgi:hypothetical protein
MALIDSGAGEIVIRMVYDGPPAAGKTTSVRALAGSLAQKRSEPRALVRDQLEPAVAASLRERALDVDHVLARLPGAAQTEGIVPAIAALLRA